MTGTNVLDEFTRKAVLRLGGHAFQHRLLIAAISHHGEHGDKRDYEEAASHAPVYPATRSASTSFQTHAGCAEPRQHVTRRSSRRRASSRAVGALPLRRLRSG